MEIVIHVLQCGSVGTDETIPDRSKSKNPYAYTGLLRGSKHKVWLPVYTYLIQHPKGNILVDTGWHSDVRVNQKKHMTWKLNMASKAKLPVGEAIDEQLLKLGIKPEELDYVFLTHLDVDHASGLKLVDKAKHICISEEEYQAMEQGDIRYHKGLWEGINLDTIKMKSSKYGPFNRSYDVFGDESVILIDLSGHSKGTMGVIIQNQGKYVILTSDSGYNSSSWKKLKLPGITVDRNKAMAALEWIQKKNTDPNCLEILATHDPEIIPHTITL